MNIKHLKTFLLILFVLKSFVINAQFTTLKNFSGNDGGGYGSLTYLNGKLYGTTNYGGTSGNGYIYSISTNGTNFTILHNFNIFSSYPCGSLLHDNGVLYGMTFGNIKLILMARVILYYTILHIIILIMEVNPMVL
jgi:uncharacterized repeat protein (TIGR03803 family)